MSARRLLPVAAVLAVCAFAPAAAYADGPVVFSASGAGPAAIQGTVDAFGSALGALNPNTGQSFPGGRREINWDGVPDSLAQPNPLPPDFFNVTSPRGLVLGGALFSRVSADSANPNDQAVRFTDLNPGYQFTTFSPQRLFAGSDRTTHVTFRIPATDRRASVSGFGAVFTDVDLADTTALHLFNDEGVELAGGFVPAASDGLSFLGLKLPAGQRAAYVRIDAGTGDLGAGEPVTDVVAMDDFVYGEPVAVAGEGTTFEKGLAEFDTHAPVGPPGGFTRESGAAHAGAKAAFSPDLTTVSDRTLVRRTAFTVPANASKPRLRFRHYYRLESGFDGGVLEVTTNKGKTWVSPPSAQYVTNPPDRTLQGSNPLAGTLAWSGADDRPVAASVLDLSPYKGQSIRFRFRLVTDASAAAPLESIPNGWYIDDVKLSGV